MVRLSSWNTITVFLDRDHRTLLSMIYRPLAAFEIHLEMIRHSIKLFHLEQGAIILIDKYSSYTP